MRSQRRTAPTPQRAIREDLVTQACLEAYAVVRHEGRLADRALEFTLRRKRHLYSNERRVISERVYALLRRQQTVDWLLDRVRAGSAPAHGSALDLLRLCASRVLHQETPRAVIASARLAGEEARALERIPEAIEALDRLPRGQRFAIAASLPDFLAKRFLAEFGDEAEAAADAMNRRAPLTARVNLLKIDRAALQARLRAEGVESRPTPLSPLGLFLETRINAFSLVAFKDGLFELQDEGSQLLGLLVDAPPTVIVDACAGAGGKTLQLAAQMKNRGELFALDIDQGRLDELRRRARRAGVHNVRARVIPPLGEAPAGALSDLLGKADRVLVDAPCSGSGTFRRKPDARYRLTEAELAHHVARQKELLAQFAPLVKPRGRLIYGTCSVLSEENQRVVATFLSSHPEFSVKPAVDLLGESLANQVCHDGFLRLAPHRHGTDGFFGAVLLRQSDRLAPAAINP